MIDDARSRLGAAAEDFTVKMGPGDDVVSRLATVGLVPADITHVVMSHLHYDHSGGIEFFPDAEIVVQRSELQFAHWPPSYQRGVYIEAGIIGFGTDAAGLNGLQTDDAPFNTLADRYIGSWAASLTTLAVMSSFIALNIATVGAAARMIFAMARDGMLPRGLAKTNARTAPAIAVVFVGLFALATLCIGGIWSPGELAGWSAYVGTLSFIAAYALLVVGLPRFFLRTHRDEFSTLRHVVVPVVGLVGVCVVAYGNIHPTPAAPLRYFIWATIALIAVTAATAVWLDRSDPEKLAKAGQVFGSEDDAVAGRPVLRGAAHG